MKRDTTTLKTYFETGKYPTEAQFIDLIDSFLNIEENNAVSSITDNGDGTYTFHLQTGSIILDVQSLPNDIPISAIAGLQVILDNIPNQYLRKDQNGVISGTLQMASNSAIKGNGVGSSNVAYFSFFETNGTTRQGYIGFGSGANSDLIISNDVASSFLRLGQAGGVNDLTYFQAGGTKTIWHSGNDGSGSGLDADTLRGVHWGNVNVPVTISAPATTNPSLFIRNNSVSSTDSSGEATLQFGYSNHISSKISSFKESTNVSGLKFYTEQGFNTIVERMYLAGNGNLEVGGNLTAINRMTIATSTTGTADLRIGNGRNGNGHSLLDLVGDTTYSGYGLRVQRSNGGANSVSNIDHRGTGALRIRVIEAGSIEFHTSNSVRLTIASGGAATFSSTVTATNFILSSDERLKTEIKPITELFSKVEWISFEAKESPRQKRYGVVAQELEKHHPEFVSTDSEGMKSVAYIDLLVAKMAEKDKQIKELQTRLDKLESLIEKLV